MRRLVAALLALALLAVLADRGAALAAERAVASRLQAAGHLASEPSVSIRGVPFLTQAVAGRYAEVVVAARDVPAGGSTLTSLTAVLRGVHVPLSAALSRSVQAVPVDRVDATVLLSYPDLQRRLGARGITLSAAGPQLRVSATVDLLGRSLTASSLSTVALSNGSIVVTASSIQTGGPLDAALSAALRGRLDFAVRVGRLPYGLQLTGVSVTPAGLVVTAGATGALLHP